METPVSLAMLLPKPVQILTQQQGRGRPRGVPVPSHSQDEEAGHLWPRKSAGQHPIEWQLVT
jgi:hypothetical protein